MQLLTLSIGAVYYAYVHLHLTYNLNNNTYLAFQVVAYVQYLDCHHCSPHL